MTLRNARCNDKDVINITLTLLTQTLMILIIIIIINAVIMKLFYFVCST